MDYHDDTLTNAHRNRAASRKLFEQWNNANTNGRAADEFPSTNRMLPFGTSNSISTLQSIQQPFPHSQFAQVNPFNQINQIQMATPPSSLLFNGLLEGRNRCFIPFALFPHLFFSF